MIALAEYILFRFLEFTISIGNVFFSLFIIMYIYSFLFYIVWQLQFSTILEVVVECKGMCRLLISWCSFFVIGHVLLRNL
jgi:hypothetical protein